MQTPIIILAAGRSSRLGEPKQLLPHKGTTLLNHTIQECIASQIGQVFVITGAYDETIASSLEDLEVSIRYNPNWAEGLGGSIAFGISQLPTDINGCFLVLSDQVHFTKVQLLNIINVLTENDSSIVVSRYEQGQGPPVYFDKSYWEELLALRGDDGAKAIIQRHKTVVEYVDFSLGHLDVDLPRDKKRLEG